MQVVNTQMIPWFSETDFLKSLPFLDKPDHNLITLNITKSCCCPHCEPLLGLHELSKGSSLTHTHTHTIAHHRKRITNYWKGSPTPVASEEFKCILFKSNPATPWNIKTSEGTHLRTKGDYVTLHKLFLIFSISAVALDCCEKRLPVQKTLSSYLLGKTNFAMQFNLRWFKVKWFKMGHIVLLYDLSQCVQRQESWVPVRSIDQSEHISHSHVDSRGIRVVLILKRKTNFIYLLAIIVQWFDLRKVQGAFRCVI